MLYYSPAQAAKQLNLCRQTILNRIQDGSIKAVKLGPKTIRISEAELQKFMDERAITT